MRKLHKSPLQHSLLYRQTSSAVSAVTISPPPYFVGKFFFELECIVCPGLTVREMELGKTDLHVSVTLLDNDLDLRRRNRCHLGLLSFTITESPPRMRLQ